MPVGRPSKYTEELGKQICDELIVGRSLRSICKEEWAPGLTTVIRWLVDNEPFRLHYTRAREQQAELMADELIEIADDGTNDYVELQKKNGTVVLCDNEHINRSRLRVDARKWAASKLLPKKYGDKVAVTDPEGGQAVLKVLIEHVGNQGKTPA
jgi:hypothetical protein